MKLFTILTLGTAILAILGPLLLSYFIGGWVAVYFSPTFRFKDIPNLNGKVVIVTGSNTGIGYTTARELFRKGAHVIATSRNKQKGETTVSRILAEVGDSNSQGKIEYIELDLSSFGSVKLFANSVLKKFTKIDILILNAGVMMCPFEKTADGIELQIGTNHFGHFLLTKLLLPLIEKQKSPCRIVTVSSIAHHGLEYPGGIRFDSFDNDGGYNDIQAYGQSKLANVLFANELARRYNNTHITSNSLHPGSITTDLVRHVQNKDIFSPYLLSIIKLISMDADQGALNQLYVATSPNLDGVTGKYFMPVGKVTSPNPLASDITLQTKLWKKSEELIQVLER